MKVLMVEYSGNSGPANYSCQLCQELGQKDIDVTLITNEAYRELPTELLRSYTGRFYGTNRSNI